MSIKIDKINMEQELEPEFEMDEQFQQMRRKNKEAIQSFVPLSMDEKAQLKKQMDYAQASLNQIKASAPRFKLTCQTTVSHLKNLMKSKFEESQKAILGLNQFVTDSNQQIERLNKKMVDDKIKLEHEQVEIEKAQKFLQQQKLDEEAEAQYKAFLMDCDNTVNEHIDFFADIVDAKEIRNAKIRQFMQSIKGPVYSIKNPPPVLKRPKTTTNYNMPPIQFNPQAKQLIFRVETFECKIVEFILFYDAQSEKFGIKNPSKVFESCDMSAVRTFNYHKDVNRLYSEFCLLVVKYIDDADDLPIYEGP